MHFLVSTTTTTTAAAPSAGLACFKNPLIWVCQQLQQHLGTGNALAPLVQAVLDGIVVFVLVLIAGQVLRRVLVAAAERRADPQVHALTRNLMTIFTWVFAVAGGLVAAGVDVLWVLTFGSIFSLAVGLAFQDLLRNILAGIFVLLEKPFRIGDHVAIGDCEGVVQTIALRTTALRTGDGRLAVMPNLTVFTSVILNSTAFDQRRYSVELPVEAGTDLSAFERAANSALEAVSGVAKEPAPTVRPTVTPDGRSVLAVSFWVDYRAHDPDTVSGELLSRIWGGSSGSVGGAARKGPVRPRH
ncbi:MAG: mechanosensitive ion channel domain-containing protein [Candidatus Dormibacteria bacterium]|jgi:small-conductance mechanosensitive channel